MKAARLNAGSLEIQDLPTPEPGIEEARIQISSAGVCHSDLHIVRGDWAGVPDTSPVGHEAIGVVRIGGVVRKFGWKVLKRVGRNEHYGFTVWHLRIGRVVGKGMWLEAGCRSDDLRISGIGRRFATKPQCFLVSDRLSEPGWLPFLLNPQ